ncbi:MAG: SCO family protein [Myxococcaceae bacterium]
MLRISFLLLGLSLFAGEGSLMVPKIMEGTEISDKRGAVLPRDILLTNHLGQPVRLGDYLGRKPLILILGYNKCPMLCNLVLNGTIDSIKGQSLKLGHDFEILSVSVNPEETADLAHSRRANYLKSMGAPENSAFEFLIGEEAQVKRLADTVGFGYKFHKPSGEYVHSAGIFIVSPDGTLTRTLYGISFKSADLKMSLIDASNGKIGSILDRIILSCFHYQPDSHKYGVYVFGIMRLAGLLTILILGVAVFMMWKREV